MRKSIRLGTLAGLAALMFTPTAFAEDAAPFGDSSTASVTYADLDPARPMDAAILHQRIVKASKAACRRPDLIEGQTGMTARAACFREAVHKTVASIGSDAQWADALWDVHLSRFAWAADYADDGPQTAFAVVSRER